MKIEGNVLGSGEHSLLCRRSFGSSHNPHHRGEGTRDEALRTSGREAKEDMICLPPVARAYFQFLDAQCPPRLCKYVLT